MTESLRDAGQTKKTFTTGFTVLAIAQAISGGGGEEVEEGGGGREGVCEEKE